jgi:hypothetical protein
MNSQQSLQTIPFKERLYRALCNPFYGKEWLDNEVEVEKEYGFCRKPFIVRIANVLLLTVLLVIILLCINELVKNEILKWENSLSSIITFFAVIIAYQQWKANKHETSIDKYYDRLDIANKRLEVLPDVNKEDVYVFAELDKLEYVIMKYELGYISPHLALRGVKNFESLCKNRTGFKAKAEKWITNAAYLDVTKSVANKVFSKVQ